MSQENAMHHKPATNAPFDVARAKWVFDNAGRQLSVVGATRRHIVVAAGPERVRLRRRRLERFGFDTVGDIHIYVSHYLVAQEETA